MKLSNREKYLICAVTVIIIAFLVYNYAYTPLTNATNELKTEANNLSFEVEALKIKQANTVKVKEEIDVLKTSLKDDFEDFPNTWDDPELLYYVEKIVGKLAYNEHIEFKKEDQKEENDSDKDDVQVSYGNIMIEFLGEYKAVSDLLVAFEKSKYFNNILQLEVKPSEENNEDIENAKYFDILVHYVFFDKDLGSYLKKYEFERGNYGKKNLFLK